MKKMPKKYSFLEMKIEAGEFNPQEMRKTFLEALYENFPEVKVAKDLKKGADEDYASFKDVCKAYYTFFRKEKYYGRYADTAIVDSGSCCGVHELSFCDYALTTKAETNTKKILLALVAGFADTYQTYFYLKYYDSGEVHRSDHGGDYDDEYDDDYSEEYVDHLPGPAIFAELQKLGWKCTGRFINPNHDWPNYEMSANYGEDTRG